MKNYILDYGENSVFKGLKFDVKFLEEGIQIAKLKSVQDVAIWQEDEKKITLDLDFLKELKGIKKLHVLVNLSKKTNIEGLYDLTNLKELRWAVDSDFQLDFSKLTTLVNLNIAYNNSFLNWDKLVNLKKLFVQKVKSENLNFLSELTNLNNLRINGGSLKSLEGIEHCENIQYIDIQSCYKLIEVEEVLNKLPKLKGISIESCKKIDLSDEFISKWGEKIFIL